MLNLSLNFDKSISMGHEIQIKFQYCSVFKAVRFFDISINYFTFSIFKDPKEVT